MTPTLFPSVFTIEIGDTPTVTFEAKSLREANEICNAPWLREDFTSTHSNGAPLWDGEAPLRARVGYADEIATSTMLPKMLDHPMECCWSISSNWTTMTLQKIPNPVRYATALRSDGKDSCEQPDLLEPRKRKSPARNAGLGTG